MELVYLTFSRIVSSIGVMDVILPAEMEKERSDNEALVERRAWARASIRIESFLFFFFGLVVSASD